MSPLEARPGALVVTAGVVLVFALATCGGEDDPSSATTSKPAGASVRGLDLANCAEPEYGGDEKPEGLIVSDLPMQGESAERSEQQAEAVRIVLGENDWEAGATPIAFQACDDSIAKTGLWDEATCEENATAYAADERVLAVIGTYNSGCAAIEIPILGKAGVAMVSPGNTAVCLTEPSSDCEDGQPNSLYPSERNYARVIPNDAFQGAALATYLDGLGSIRPFVAYAADDPTSTGQAKNFRGAAEELGMGVAGFEAWNPEAEDYRALFTRAEKADADAVILAGLTEQNGARVIADKVEYVGDNSQVPLLAFDGFSQQATIDEAGGAAKGMLAGLPGIGGDDLPKAGQDLIAQLEESLGDGPIEQFAPYAGQAAQVVLDAIEEGGTDRSAISAALFGTQIEDGIVGSFEVTERGDPSVGPITILEAGESFEPAATVKPDEAVVTAARG